MPTVTLTSCTPYVIYPTEDDDPPEDLSFTASAGGTLGDGVVQVTTGDPPIGVGSFPAGGALPSPLGIPGATLVSLHYQALPGKPTTVQVTYSITKP